MPIAETQQTTSQHAVPQNVMDVEFKLIGDMTLRQFAYLLICGILSYVCFVAVVGIFKWPAVIFFALLGVTLAFIPIQDRGMDEWVVNFITAMFMPTQRVWHKAPMIPHAFLYQSIDVVKQEMITLAPTSSRRKLEKYLDYGAKGIERDPLDIPEEEYIVKVKRAFASPFVAAPSPGVSVAVSDQVPAGPTGKQVSAPAEEGKEGPDEKQGAAPAAEGEGPQPQEAAPPGGKPAPAAEGEGPQAQAVQPAQPFPPQVAPPAPSQQEFVSVNLMTPDRHSGRRFSSFLPSDGEIFLPIRGERVLKTSAEQNIEEDITEKAQQLQMLLNQISGDGGVKKEPPGVSGIRKAKEKVTVSKQEVEKPAQEEKQGDKGIHEVAKEAADSLKEENKKLAGEIEKLRQDISSVGDTSAKETKKKALKELEAKKERTQSDYEALQRQVAELQEKLRQRQDSAAKPQAPESVRDYNVAPKFLTNKPNVLSGVARDSAGNVLEELLLIVKDNKGNPVRAFKTNKLGEFVLTTPLTNGMYTVEVSTANETTLSFDIISIEAKGEAIPPIELAGS